MKVTFALYVCGCFKIVKLPYTEKSGFNKIILIPITPKRLLQLRLGHYLHSEVFSIQFYYSVTKLTFRTKSKAIKKSVQLMRNTFDSLNGCFKKFLEFKFAYK